jgi:branched-chain amino acid transport system ATP-binding protein
LDGQPIHTLPPRAIAGAGVAFVPQEANIFPALTVRENLEIGGWLDPAHVRARIDTAFDRFAMLAEKRSRPARTLSGGQRQVLAMAMALMVAPRLLLLDEPSAGLSPVAAETLFATIVEVNAGGVAIAMVEQNANEALGFAHRGMVMVDGKDRREGQAAVLRGDEEIGRLFLGLAPAPIVTAPPGEA